jgi:hypothetical protein
MPFLSYSPGPLSQMWDYAAQQGTSPTCQPPTGSLSPPPAPLTMVHEWGLRRRRPVCARTGRSMNRGCTITQGPPFYAPPLFTHERGLCRKPPFAPFAGRGKVCAPSLGPRSHANREVCPPFLPRKCLRPAPICVRTRFAPESRRGMALPFRHEQVLCRKPLPRLRGAGR